MFKILGLCLSYTGFCFLYYFCAVQDSSDEKATKPVLVLSLKYGGTMNNSSSYFLVNFRL